MKDNYEEKIKFQEIQINKLQELLNNYREQNDKLL